MSDEDKKAATDFLKIVSGEALNSLQALAKKSYPYAAKFMDILRDKKGPSGVLEFLSNLKRDKKGRIVFEGEYKEILKEARNGVGRRIAVHSLVIGAGGPIVAEGMRAVLPNIKLFEGRVANDVATYGLVAGSNMVTESAVALRPEALQEGMAGLLEIINASVAMEVGIDHLKGRNLQ